MMDSDKRLDKGGISSLKRKLLTSLLAKEGIELSRKIPKRETSGAIPLSFAQQRLWFIDQLDPGNPVYNCPGAVRMEGRLDLDVLERVINEVVRRHEVLRTRFEVKEGEPAQVIDEWKHQKLEIEDLTGLSDQE